MHVFAERRKELRSHADFTAGVRVLDSDIKLDTRILDCSKDGLAILSPRHLRFDAPVAVTFKGILILAEVVYCLPFAAGYRVGLRVDQAMATSTAKRPVGEVIRELQVAIALLPSNELLEEVSAA